MSAPTLGRSGGRRGSWMLAAVAVALLVIGGMLTFGPSNPDGQAVLGPSGNSAAASAPDPAPAAEPPTTPAASPPAPSVRPPHAGQRHPRLHPGPPTELRIHSLGVISPVVPIDAPDRTLIPPSDPQVLGWWAPGARPGVRRGSALITGHTVHTGGGALDHLGDLAVGALVEVRTPRMRMPYVVRKVRVYSKGRVSTDAARLFDQDVLGRLVIITCGDWNGTEYLSNVVVTAVPQHGRAYLAQHPSRRERLAPSVLPIRQHR